MGLRSKLTPRYLVGAVAGFAAAFGVSGVPGFSGTAQAQQANSAWQASDDDFLLLQFTVNRHKLNQDVRGYQTDRGICLDLADVIQSLDLPIRLDKKSRRATGWLFSEDQQFTLDREANTVQNMNINGGRGAAPLSNEIYDTPEGWCVDTEALSRWFGISFTPDLFNASVALESEQTLPFIEALERRSRAARLRPKREAFDLGEYPHADMEYRVWRTPSVDMVVRLGFDAPASGGVSTRAKAEAYVAGELAGASYTARLATDNTLMPSSVRFRAYRFQREGGLLGPLDATQVAAGDVETLSGQLTGQTAVGRGIFVSNRPLGRGSRFSTTTLRGILPAGWDAELYRNGQLIAFQDDSDDGRYEFVDIDLYFGRNELVVVLYGPQGQIRREKANVPVGQNLVEPGKTYYWAGALQQGRDLIELARAPPKPDEGAWRWGAGVERGLGQRTSLGLGIQSLRLGGRRRNYIEGQLLRTLGPAQVEFSAAHEWGAGFALQGNAAARIGAFNLGVSGALTEGRFTSEFVAANLSHSVAFRADTSLKFGKFSIPIQAGIGHSAQRDGGSVTEWLMAASFNTRKVNISAQVEGRRRVDAVTGGSSDDANLRLLANTRLFGIRLRGAAGFTLIGPEKGFDYARVSVNEDLDDVSEIRGEIEYQAKSELTRFRLGYSRRFERFAIRGDATFSTDGGIGAALSLNFSFGPDPRAGGIRFSESKLARFGQADVTVFRDDNGDGRFNADEEALPDVMVEAGFRTTNAITDEVGRTIVDELRPHVPVLVGIDESTLDDPFLVPATKGVVVVPRPGVSARIFLPVTPSGEVEGVIHSISGTPIEGVMLELLDSRGSVVASTLSEYDGFFLFDRVPYGRYQLRVATDSAAVLGVSESISPAVVLGRDSDLHRAGIIKLSPAGPTTIATAAPPEPAGSSP